jgi:hypothetical protein
MEIELDRINIKTERQFLWKRDLIDLAIKIGTVHKDNRDNFNCYIRISGSSSDPEILDAPSPPIDVNCYPILRIYTCGTTCF